MATPVHSRFMQIAQRTPYSLAAHPCTICSHTVQPLMKVDELTAVDKMACGVLKEKNIVIEYRKPSAADDVAEDTLDEVWMLIFTTLPLLAAAASFVANGGSIDAKWKTLQIGFGLTAFVMYVRCWTHPSPSSIAALACMHWPINHYHMRSSSINRRSIMATTTAVVCARSVRYDNLARGRGAVFMYHNVETFWTTKLFLEAIRGMLPCTQGGCEHRIQVHQLPNNRGFKMRRACSARVASWPFLICDKLGCQVRCVSPPTPANPPRPRHSPSALDDAQPPPIRRALDFELHQTHRALCITPRTQCVGNSCEDRQHRPDTTVHVPCHKSDAGEGCECWHEGPVTAVRMNIILHVYIMSSMRTYACPRQTAV
jgi:hypothetical protein